MVCCKGKKIEAVSYTHLDVYKRQVMVIVTDEWRGMIAVSYTHLDVYKRQLLTVALYVNYSYILFVIR